MLVFYLQIFSAVLYLFYIQMRGQLGYTERKYVRDRYRADALEYYEIDIFWFSFNFVNLGLHVYTIFEIWKDLKNNLMLSVFILAIYRILSIFLLSPFRN